MSYGKKYLSQLRPRYCFTNLVQTNAAPIMVEQYAVPTLSDWARFCEVDRTQIIRWRDYGIPERQADRIAVKCLGMHPSLIWPEWFDQVPK